MADRRHEIEQALGPSSPAVVDRDAVYESVQKRLRKDRAMRPVRRVIAVGAVLLVAAIAFSTTSQTGAPRGEPGIAERTAAAPPRLREDADWLAVAQAPDTRMTTRQTDDGVRLSLDEGGVAVEVRPRSGRRLLIDTASAEVEIVGTTVAVLVRGDVTDVAVGAGRVRVRPRGGHFRQLVAGDRVSIGARIDPLAETRAALELLSALPGRWHERLQRPVADRPATEPSPAGPAAPGPACGSPSVGFGARGCEAAAEASIVAQNTAAPRLARKAALELLANCGNATEKARHLQALVELVPNHPLAWMELGRLRELGGDRTNAALAYRRQVALGGGLADEAALALCRVSWDRRACLQRFVAERPDSDRRQEAEDQLQAQP